MKVREDWKLRDPCGYEDALWDMGINEHSDLGIKRDIAGSGRDIYVDRVTVGDKVMIIKTLVDDCDKAPSPIGFRMNNIEKTVGLLGLQNRTDTEGGLPCR